MIDNELGLWLVFKCCIYNFRELKSEIGAKGYRFFSEGDTEVILKSYHTWGPNCVRKFKGMFAFAVWERDSGRVVLARDRLGIKPLYYTEGGAIEAMSKPIVSHDSVAFFLLSAEVAQRVKVVQTGQGADEVSGGYSWSPSFLAADDATEQYQGAYFDWSHVDLARLMSPEFVRKISASGLSRISLHRPSASTAVDKALQIDTEIMLVDDPVKRVDSMTMAHGLEARVPFLDHEVVELAARIPANLKVRGDGKYILREAARKFVPAEVIDRSKGYLPVPSLRYLRGPSCPASRKS
ncbi:hypothetical protein CQ13_04495 [Bradyrhizobium retamae]|uniref:asparagine synthase (glutamine-hydrolyzing) n=2 Tax=Bradyrhizobium retamae TaxID=1300035 RepID=A0A0R3N6M3_9BRAD|nr:hypothetical protein CQ13_04495 [Bradyrhizobium retamae]